MNSTYHLRILTAVQSKDKSEIPSVLENLCKNLMNEGKSMTKPSEHRKKSEHEKTDVNKDKRKSQEDEIELEGKSKSKRDKSKSEDGKPKSEKNKSKFAN